MIEDIMTAGAEKTETKKNPFEGQSMPEAIDQLRAMYVYAVGHPDRYGWLTFRTGQFLDVYEARQERKASRREYRLAMGIQPGVSTRMADKQPPSTRQTNLTLSGVRHQDQPPRSSSAHDAGPHNLKFDA